jgi:hypothetical protein
LHGIGINNINALKDKRSNEKTFLLLITAVSALVGGLLFGDNTEVINGA